MLLLLRHMSNKKTYILILVVVVAATIYFLYDPEDTSNPYPKCPFFMLTGWKCPGCGLQRAVHDLLHLDIAGAAHHNILLIVALPLVCFFFFVDRMKTRLPRLYAFANHPVTTVVLIAIVLAWWVLRNIYGR